MILKVFTVYDQAAKAYLQPFFTATTTQAIRTFREIVNQKDHLFNKYPGDYTLFELGEWDDNSAAFHDYEVPVKLGLGLEFIAEKPATWSESTNASIGN